MLLFDVMSGTGYFKGMANIKSDWNTDIGFNFPQSFWGGWVYY